MRKIVFELCAESIAGCIAARDGGADRIELCTGLSEDGLTPSHALITEAIRRSGLPVHVLLRPRGGDFVYSADEFALMRVDLLHAKELGAAGIVLGVLQADGRVDVERTKELVALAAPLQVTFHRAFDHAASLEAALEDVIATGCSRVLTSGGAAMVSSGATMLAKLVRQAAGRIEIAVGGGLRLEDAAMVAETTGAVHFHGSVRRREVAPIVESQAIVTARDGAVLRWNVYPEDIRSMIGALSA